MPPDESFRTFVLDQLQDLPAVSFRSMFGAGGLYSNGVFFGIIYEDRLYLKTDEESRSCYEQRKMECLRTEHGQTLRTYFQVPVEVLESAPRLTCWARRAVEAQLETDG